MHRNSKSFVSKEQDLLVSVARTIGSTLGAVAAKVGPTTSKSKRRPAVRKARRAKKRPVLIKRKTGRAKSSPKNAKTRTSRR
jgi:hypothetical protein